MLKVLINIDKRIATLVDDSESTPGASRAMSAFRTHVLPKINDILASKTTLAGSRLAKIFTTVFKGDGLKFAASTINSKDDVNFDMTFVLLADNTPTAPKRMLSWVKVGRCILALLLGLVVGGLLKTLL